MNIKIEKLSMTNFKCFKHKEIPISDAIVQIRGRNGSGKTTIADAILWCLFGKNSAGQTDFDIKTKDESGNPIPHLDHSVELEISCDGVIHTLKRTIKETWIKKRGADEQVFKNNTTEYMVDGEVMAAGDYKKWVADFVAEDVFRAITNPQYFPSLKWQIQRDFLSKLAGHISHDDIVGGDAGLSSLKGILEQQDIISYRKHLSYQIKQVKDKLDKIPVRLEEQNKALPEKEDWSVAENRLRELDEKAAELEKKIAQVSFGNADDVKRNELRSKIVEVEKKMDSLHRLASGKSYELQKAKDKNINDVRRSFSETTRNITELSAKIGSYDMLVARCKQVLSDCEREAFEIRTKWSFNEKSRPQLTNDDTICPTCGQQLPEDLIAEKLEQMRKFHAENKEKVRSELSLKAGMVKSMKADAEKQLQEYADNRAEDEKHMAEFKESLNNIQSSLHKMESEVVPTTNEILMQDNDYLDLQAEYDKLNDALQAPSVQDNDKDMLDTLTDERNENKRERMQVLERISAKNQYDKILGLIAGIEKEREELVSQLSELERQEDLAKKYQFREIAMIEKAVNSHFKLAKWRLFRTVNNGGDPFEEPYCECYVNGVAYHDGLNQAARLNVGLDICETLGHHYQVFAPIVIDNAEANLNILQTTGQQIRMYVNDSDLQIM